MPRPIPAKALNSTRIGIDTLPTGSSSTKRRKETIVTSAENNKRMREGRQLRASLQSFDSTADLLTLSNVTPHSHDTLDELVSFETMPQERSPPASLNGLQSANSKTSPKAQKKVILPKTSHKESQKSLYKNWHDLIPRLVPALQDYLAWMADHSQPPDHQEYQLCQCDTPTYNAYELRCYFWSCESYVLRTS